MEFNFAGVSVSSYTIHSLMLCGIKLLCIIVINSKTKLNFRVIQCLINHLLFNTEILVLVDRRTTLAQLKEELVPLIGVPPTGFRVCEIRYYYYNEEYEMGRLDQTFKYIKSGSKVHVCVLF